MQKNAARVLTEFTDIKVGDIFSPSATDNSAGPHFRLIVTEVTEDYIYSLSFVLGGDGTSYKNRHDDWEYFHVLCNMPVELAIALYISEIKDKPNW